MSHSGATGKPKSSANLAGQSSERENRDTAIAGGFVAAFVLGGIHFIIGVMTNVVAICPREPDGWTEVYYLGIWAIPLSAIGAGAVLYRRLSSRTWE